jgi:predicted metal-dependent hydrolase
MRRITVFFLADALRQTAANLRRDGTLWRWSTWRSAGRHLFGRQGLLRANRAAWRDYFRADFHPDQQHTERSADWLRDNSALFVAVGR